MPSLPASAVGCAIGIADADKVGIATIAQAARLIKSRRRMGSLLVRPRFSRRWRNAFKRGEFHEAKVARLHWRNPATAMRTRAGRKRSGGLDTIVLRSRRLLIGPGCVLLIGLVAADNASSNGPTLPCPARWPATPPTIAPLMQPFATALAGANAMPRMAVQRINGFTAVLRKNSRSNNPSCRDRFGRSGTPLDKTAPRRCRRINLASAGYGYAEQECDEQAREWGFPGNGADGRERLAGLAR